MSETIRTDVTEANISGDFSGGNMTKLVFSSIEDTTCYMTTLINKFKKEKESNKQIDENIEELLHYKNPVDEVLIGLDAKLQNGGFEQIADYAKRAKERFTKKLIRYEYYESAQEICVYLLALAESNFNKFIYPLILKKSDTQVIQTLVEQYICKAIIKELGENVLSLNKVEIDGMIYFLTGNCHIKWD